MSTTTTTHRLPFGRGLGAAAGCAVLVAAATTVGLALPRHDSTQPLEPTSECVTATCHVESHPLLPGRHDFGIRPEAGGGGGQQTTISGGRVVGSQP